MRTGALFLFGLLLLVGIVSALPTTQAATLIGNNNFTMNGNGAVGTSWFQWGFVSGSAWAHTPNQTPAAGVIKYTLSHTPVFGCTSYVYRACDSTGCGSEVFLTTPIVTPLPQVIVGDIAQNMTENGLDPLNMAWNSVRPYTDVTSYTMFYALVLMALFVGMWLRTRGTQTATTIGMISAALFVSAGVGLGLGLPPEFVAVGQAVMYVSLAGAVLMFTFK